MITLALLKFLENNGFGKIDKDLFWQKLDLGNEGIYIVSIGAESTRFTRKVQRYEIYSRANNDFDALTKLEKIADFLNNSYGVCELPAVPEFGIKNSHHNITINPLSSPTRVGIDENNRAIWSVTGRISYK